MKIAQEYEKIRKFFDRNPIERQSGRTSQVNNEEKSIHQLVYDALFAKHLFSSVRALMLIFRQNRFLEVLYGIFCFLFHKPSLLGNSGLNENLDEIIQVGRKIYVEKQSEYSNLRRERSFNFLPHGYVILENALVIGEYADNSARIFIENRRDKCDTIDFYRDYRGVRHIHSLLRDGASLFVSTGDSKKFLDQWEITDGQLRFQKRILRLCFGGFTACCVINGLRFFATDFSGRPNYIFCLEKKRKYFFPKPAYTHYCLHMLPVFDRYIICISYSLPYLFPDRSLSIFDIQIFQYIYCKGYSCNGLRLLLSNYS